jgi:hypothetical protein
MGRSEQADNEGSLAVLGDPATSVDHAAVNVIERREQFNDAGEGASAVM